MVAGVLVNRWCRASCVGLTLGLIALGASTPASADDRFPFDRELLLDTKPMRGSKRIPGIEVSASGQAAIDLWCNSGRGQVVIAADTITIIPGPMSERQCGPDQMRGDEDMIATLNQVTNWRREGNSVVLIGPKMLRFRPATN
jgi:heat shock protein HslJ